MQVKSIASGENGKCRALRQNVLSAHEKRQRPVGWSSGREHRLIREKVQKVTWIR